MRSPKTEAEWQEGVNMAAFLLAIHSAVLYGLLETDLKIDVGRCDDILVAGRSRDIFPIGIDELVKRYTRKL